MGVMVERPGMLTTVQDAGRWGYQRFGVSASGAMDLLSYRLANRVVGNVGDEAALEVTSAGPVLRFEAATRFAVCGAEFELMLDERRVTSRVGWVAGPGQRLSFGRCLAGVRAYLAVRGGFDVPAIFGSRSTHVPSRMGGLSGRALRAGDRVPVGVPDPHRGTSRPVGRVRPIVKLPRGGARIRVIPGADDTGCGSDLRDAFFASRYTVSSASDRMGYRLQCAPLPIRRAGEGISTAVPAGSIQVPPDGQPIILMADRQTIGGYPQIATVITADIPLVGQLAVSSWIEFEACGQADALRAQIAQERRLLG